jgi:hypothetical protein
MNRHSDVTAIDVLLEPDATMLNHAEEDNAHLIEVHPDGYRLDDAHRPHITMLQRYVRTDDLSAVSEVVAKVLGERTIGRWVLTACGYYFIGWGDIGLAGIVVAPTPELLELQQELIAAVAPFTEEHGTADAFHATIQDPEINQPTIDYVAAFVPLGTGEQFNPHVSIGIATRVFLDEMISRPFDEFSFSVVGGAMFQLGNFGTASKRLSGWSFES